MFYAANKEISTTIGNELLKGLDLSKVRSVSAYLYLTNNTLGKFSFTYLYLNKHFFHC